MLVDYGSRDKLLCLFSRFRSEMHRRLEPLERASDIQQTA